MVQAARSGRQNIAEGSRAAAASSQTELRLLNTARSSLEELLLDRQIAALEKAFVEGGGYSEQLAAARLAERERRRHDPPDPSDPPARIPRCPQCGKPMVLRTAQKGKSAGKQFWGCSAYPDCKGVVEN
jgi:four helix bundle suffix protein